MDNTKSHPYVSLILVTWNGLPYLDKCLQALTAQTCRDFEVILIDNGSTDGSLDGLEGNWSQLDLQIKRIDSNLGFASANNIGARLARGRWLALLNPDAFPEPEWLEGLLQAAQERPEFASFTSRQIQANAPGLLDGAGDSYHISGLGWRRYYNCPAKNSGIQPEEVFSACGAAALYLREDFLGAGGFDEDYFSYFEDVDLGFRLRLSGKKCLYVPQAVVHHLGSASTGRRSDLSVYYAYRNLIWTFFKDMPAGLFWLCLPLHIGTLLFFTAYLTMRGQGRTIGRALHDAALGLPKAWKKRRAIQKSAKVGSAEMLRVMSTGILEPYLEFMRRNTGK